MMTVIQRDFFFDVLVKRNNLTAFKEWFFYEGMLFGSHDKWWGGEGQRPVYHEGLDLLFYKDTSNRLRQLGRSFKVPVVADGTIIEISDDDYLGKSVFVCHDIIDNHLNNLHSVYAHVLPMENFKINDVVEAGDVIATTADVSQQSLVIPSHLHISMIWLSRDYPKELLKWQILPKSDDAILVDPLKFLDCHYSTDNYQHKGKNDPYAK